MVSEGEKERKSWKIFSVTINFSQQSNGTKISSYFLHCFIAICLLEFQQQSTHDALITHVSSVSYVQNRIFFPMNQMPNIPFHRGLALIPHLTTDGSSVFLIYIK